MITNAKKCRQLNRVRRVATRFNVLSFKNYDGTTTLKVITRDQYDRMNAVFNR